jgi:hypothetical protein
MAFTWETSRADRPQRNRCMCRKCGCIIESVAVYDFVQCACGAIFVDGGHEYLRRGGNPEDIINIGDNDAYALLLARQFMDGTMPESDGVKPRRTSWDILLEPEDL